MALKRRSRESDSHGNPGMLELGGGRAALQGTLQKLLEEKTSSASQPALEIINHLGMVRVDAKKQGFDLRVYGGEEGPAVKVLAALTELGAPHLGGYGKMDDKGTHVSRLSGEPPPETEQELRNKIGFVNMLE